MTSELRSHTLLLLCFLFFFTCQFNGKFCVEYFAEPRFMAFDLVQLLKFLLTKFPVLKCTKLKAINLGSAKYLTQNFPLNWQVKKNNNHNNKSV